MQSFWARLMQGSQRHAYFCLFVAALFSCVFSIVFLHRCILREQAQSFFGGHRTRCVTDCVAFHSVDPFALIFLCFCRICFASWARKAASRHGLGHRTPAATDSVCFRCLLASSLRCIDVQVVKCVSRWFEHDCCCMFRAAPTHTHCSNHRVQPSSTS